MGGKAPYTKSPGSIPKFMSHIQDIGVPTKVTVQYLASLGYKSSNDRYLVGLLKEIGFLDASGSPTARWREYRDKNKARSVMADAVRDGYPGLFEVYSDAFRRDDEAITNWIRGNTDYSGDTVQRVLGSFRALCDLADFNGAPALAAPPHISDHVASQHQTPVAASAGPVLASTTVGSAPGTPQVTINIELQLPASASAETYNDFFAAMRTHLFDGPDAS